MAQIHDMQLEIGEIKPPKWEYLCTWFGFDEQKDLTELGQLGWELVTVVVIQHESLRAYFKRPIWNPE